MSTYYRCSGYRSFIECKECYHGFPHVKNEFCSSYDKKECIHGVKGKFRCIDYKDEFSFIMERVIQDADMSK